MMDETTYISFNELSNFISNSGLFTIEHITKETDLRKLYILLKYYLNGIETGTNIQSNFTLDFLLDMITNDNVDEMCRIIKCALQIQSNDEECIRLIGQFSHVQNYPICLRNLKIMNTLLTMKCSTDTSLLSTYLNHLFIEQPEYKYFVSNLLPKFLSEDISMLNLVWRKCCEDKSLVLLSSVPSAALFLFSQTWVHILKLDDFWVLLTNDLIVSEGFKYKAAMYLFQMSLDVLRSQNDLNINNLYINNGILQSDNKSFDYFCILSDVVREKQVHLIEPSLHLLHKLDMPSVWLNIIYNKFLCHPHNAVAHKAALYFMKQEVKQDLAFGSLFVALNKNDDSKLSKIVFRGLQWFASQLTQERYEHLMSKSLLIIWNPVAFYNFYKNTLIRQLDLTITLELIRKCKHLPHKYIRQGVMFMIFTKLKNDITERVSIENYMNIIVEFMLDESYYKYATKLINVTNLQVPEDFIKELLGFLQDPSATNVRTKVDFLIEITERKDVPSELVKSLYHDFKVRKYATIVMDRLSYLYLIKATDLQDYLMERLDSSEESYSIRHMDKPSYDLISKSIGVLTSNKSCNQQLLAFEVLFYMTKSSMNVVYNHWFNKILNEKQVIAPSLALNFVTLLIKIPNNFGRQNLVRLLQVYEEFINCQADEVLVRIYRNFDFVLENISGKHLSFLEVACKKIFYLKARDDLENSIRYLVRSMALNYKSIDKQVLEFLLRKLYDAMKNESACDFVIYYTTMYFKYLNFDINLFPMYEFLLYPNAILNKNERAEYEICTEIYIDVHTSSPYFRWAEIRKWALEDVIFDQNESKVHRTVTYLLEHLQKTSDKRYFPDSTLHLHKLRAWQIFIFMLPSIEQNLSLKTTLLNNLLPALINENHQPSVRVLMQYLLIQLLKADQPNEPTSEVLFNALSTVNKTHGIINLMPVLYGLELIKNNQEFCHKVLETVLALTMGQHFKLRYSAQKLIRQICHKHQHNFKFKKYEAIYKAVDSTVKATTIKDDLDFDVVEVINAEKPWNDSKKLLYILTVYIPEIYNVTACEWEYFKIKHFWKKYLCENLKIKEEHIINAFEELSLQANDKSDNIQKKIVPWQEPLQDGANKSIGKLIVVTSLIESPANLGGLSRTCEIFGGLMLVVDNINVVERNEFRNLSMTSEKWVKIIEVKTGDLREYLQKCRMENYKILGVEQTSDSTSLENYKFDERTVLLLGNERAGIPAPLIGLLDDCVEIPQFGKIRSLNVHVAGAVVIWEYTKQQMSKQSK